MQCNLMQCNLSHLHQACTVSMNSILGLCYFVTTSIPSLPSSYCILIQLCPHHILFEHVQNLTTSCMSIKTIPETLSVSIAFLPPQYKFLLHLPNFFIYFFCGLSGNLVWCDWRGQGCGGGVCVGYDRTI